MENSNNNIICGRNPRPEGAALGQTDRQAVRSPRNGRRLCYGNNSKMPRKRHTSHKGNKPAKAGLLLQRRKPSGRGGHVCVAGVRNGGRYVRAGGNTRRKALFNNLR